MHDDRRKKRIKKANKKSLEEMNIAVQELVSEIEAVERKQRAEKILNKDEH